MVKEDKKIKIERKIIYVPLSWLSRRVGLVQSVLENWAEIGYLEAAMTDENGEWLYDKEVAFKRIKNLRRWIHKGFTPDELKVKLDSAIKHTHRWGDDYENIKE